VAKKLTIKTTRKPAVTITRSAVRTNQLVYLAVANKSLEYPHGRSRIVYVGTTKRGARRIAASAASKANEMLSGHGISSLDFYVVSCQSRQGVKTWHKLERGLILTFREMFGDIPHCNSQGSRFRWRDEDWYFTRRRLRSIVEMYSS
jgi:hypothetical protein